jgi:ABC-type transport system involved in cytochrome bd biosynthesis fused ATPase/permease subunit
MVNLKSSLIVGCIFSVIGLLIFIVSKIRDHLRFISFGWFTIFIELYVACLLIVLIEPLYGWDARSIWFFHAKMIYFNASINAGGNWFLPSIGFSHPDYPELIPIIAAQIAFVSGYWNEYLPKMSLVALLAPAILCLISILRNKWWHIFFISVPLLFTQGWLSNGYMDGYLALYAGLATFFLGRWLDEKNRIDLISGILFTGVVLELKNEGMLYSVIILCLMLFFVLIKRY